MKRLSMFLWSTVFAVILATSSKALSQEAKEKRVEGSAMSLAVLIEVKPRLLAYLKVRQAQAKELAAKYGKVIEGRFNKAADAGDLKTAEAFQVEKERLGALEKAFVAELEDPVKGVWEGGSLPKLEANSPAELVALRKIWSAEWQKIRSKVDGELQQSLKKLETDLTKARDFKNAKEVLVYRESLSSDAPTAIAVTTGSPTPSDLSGEKPGDEMVNGMRMSLCWIMPGSFTMGSPAKEQGRKEDREMQVEVELTKAFWIGKFEVTQEDYEAVMGSNPSFHKQEGKRKPVEQVSWLEAMAFCKKLTDVENKNGKLPEGWSYTLPTEYQWEYACRAGSKGPYSSRALDKIAWYKGNNNGGAREVGKKDDNKWGLHDMHGNIREWCLNPFVNNHEGGKDPKSPGSGIGRSHRGGSWLHPEFGCRSADREGSPEDYKSPRVGFRVALISDN